MQAVTISIGVAFIEFFSQQRLVVFAPYASLYPLLLATPRLMFRLSRRLRALVTARWVESIEYLGLIVVLLTAPASLLLHPMGSQYDRFLHVATVLLTAWMGLLLYLPLQKNLNGGTVVKRGALLVAAGLSLVYIFSVEGIEYGVDRLFGVEVLGDRLFGDVSQPALVDFWEDISFGVLGTILASLAAARYFDRFTATLR